MDQVAPAQIAWLIHQRTLNIHRHPSSSRVAEVPQTPVGVVWCERQHESKPR